MPGVGVGLPALLAVLALGSCTSENPDYEVGATDEGGGELMAVPAEREGVEVDLPETAMTPAPDPAGTRSAQPVKGIETMEDPAPAPDAPG